jgi:hypothetical protein
MVKCGAAGKKLTYLFMLAFWSQRSFGYEVVIVCCVVVRALFCATGISIRFSYFTLIPGLARMLIDFFLSIRYCFACDG